MEKPMQPQPNTEDKKMVPLDTSGESVDVEIKEEEKKESDVQVTQEAPPTEEPKKESKEHDEYSNKVQTRINDLTKKWREEERKAEAALQYAQSVKKENEDLKTQKNTLDESYITEFKQRAQAEEKSLQNLLQEAYQSQDFKKQAEIQAKLTDVVLQRQRAEMSLKAKQAENEKPVEEKPIPNFQSEDPKPAPKEIEPSEKAKSWVSKNPWFGNGDKQEHDLVKTMATYGIHRQLVAAGYDPESDEYYNEIDTRLNARFSDNNTLTNNSNRPAQTVAGAARSGSATGRNTVRLSPTQVQIAKKLGVPLEEYAKQVQQIAAKNT
tara:strand:- start:495 stop:1463 length:969 start_codon:yes stop_codon:yes gene_type:complete